MDDCNSEFNHCRLVAADDFGPAERVYYTVPAKGAVRRMKGSTGGFLERPISVFHMYLPYADDEIADRDQGTTKLVRHIKELLARKPTAFNSSGSVNPRDLGNRMIILGDFNMYNNQCSEVNATLRKLREEFGYAIDVSMAVTDNDHRTFDMHYSGAPITDSLFRTGTYGNCKDADWAGDWGTGSDQGCPFQYRPGSSWVAEGRPHNTGVDQRYAWWAGTDTAQGGGGSRLDLIILAGLGWADDDPVREYLAMANTEAPNIANGFRRAGVEIRHYCSDPQELTLGNPVDYHPENPVCSGIAAQPAALAFRSDHKPLGVRLRVQFYR